MSAALSPLLLEGYLLGWSVAWPPGPINAEIMRRGLARGFLAAIGVGLGASSGDALWALIAAAGAGIVLDSDAAHVALGALSTALLLALGVIFLRGAWRALVLAPDAAPAPARLDSARAGYALGLGMALTSPWNIGFWLAVMGRPDIAERGFAASLVVAGAVVLGALTWCVAFAGAVTLLRLHAASRWWEVGARAATGVLMLVFAVEGMVRLAGY